jgi:ketosteroid isomerase-like protein
MDLQQNKTVVRHLFEVINNGELDQLRDLVDANVVDHNAVIFMQPEGPGAVKEGIRCRRQSDRDPRHRRSPGNAHAARHPA